ncbi:hypothetical protein C4569_01895 [Candidatus Parcubacteria bacterium]|nr:MAG: hypothetical protein C4569_01895 [Candidatus Parcubacteria bacterium]
MTTFFQNLYIYLMIIVLAAIEIQIEGPHGWAANLPVWKPEKTTWYGSFYSKIRSGKELTGYHLFLFIFVLLIFHLPFVVSYVWNIWYEFQILSLFFLFVVFWDFLWFILNPAYGLKRFKAVHIWWHNQWLGPWPIDYYWGILCSVILILPPTVKESAIVVGWLKTFITLTILTAITVILTEGINSIKRLL